MGYAQVAVDSPIRSPAAFTYAIPPSMEVQPGQAVRVPFGRQVLRGFVLELVPASPVADTRLIAEVITPGPVISPEALSLGRWLAWRYSAPLYQALALFLPPAWETQKPKKAIYLRLKGDSFVPRSTRQALLLEKLKEGPMTLAQAREIAGEGVRSLATKGVVERIEVEVRRDPLAGKVFLHQPSLPLTPAQDGALKEIHQGLLSRKGVFLLHGVTGSGKTEVYLQALARAVALGRRGLVLVPEIALTPQTVERFLSRFPGRVALLHSGLGEGERFDTWRGISEGQYQVVIGTRSAVSAPIPDLGLVVLDEEHEWTYKQDETPYYHAREVALERGRREGAVVVLGSATPDVESYYRALKGEYRLLELPQRISPGAFPRMELVDMLQELKAGNRSPLSRALSQALAEALPAGEQVILFLNRRGLSARVQCRSCGHVLECPRCALALTRHPDGLKCHQCGSGQPLPSRCPRCGGEKWSYLGLGTQRLWEEVAQAFPQAGLLRWDRDAVTRRGAHEEVLERFRRREASILIGTQLVAKGLDIPRVTLVGVVLADIGLSYPDFRSGERTFQLIMQVSGRAGRGDWPGRVIIQTYQPQHYAVQAALANDYRAFYQQEMAYRRRYRYPPFSQMARLLYSSPSQARAGKEAEKLSRQLREAGAEVLGPSPAFYPRLRGKFRWQNLVRGEDLPRLFSSLEIPPGWAVDMDPVHLL